MAPRKHILLGICGSIAAYKSIDLVRLLKKESYRVTCILTESAKKFVSPTVLATLSEETVLDSLWGNHEIQHLKLDKGSSVMAIVPASANTLSKCALGLADDLLTTTWLNFNGKKCIAPAMHTQMWENPSIQKNVNYLLDQGVSIIEPALGELACGDYGKGRLATTETLFKHIENLALCEDIDLKGKKILISAGAMNESIDTVRCIQNKSTGQLGQQLAHLCSSLGAEITLFTSCPFPDPQILKRIEFFSNYQELESLMNQAKGFDFLFMTAAVSDYVLATHTGKLKREEQMSIKLKGTADLLKLYQEKHAETCFSVGFCLVDDLENTATILAKKDYKNLPMIIANCPDNIGAVTRNFKLFSMNTAIELKNMSLSSSCIEIVKHALEKSKQFKRSKR